MSSPKPLASEDARIRKTLARICVDTGLHARFLNTLSLLEHIGSRKIMASQSRAELGQDTLKHLAEETRHAFFFKRAAEAIARRPLRYGPMETVAGFEARAYMGRLDAFIARQARGDAAYLYMSLVVELRAIRFYKVYQNVLKEVGLPLSLASVLSEEMRHLEEMRERLMRLGEKTDERLPGFVAFEQNRFDAFLGALERGVAASALAAE